MTFALSYLLVGAVLARVLSRPHRAGLAAPVPLWQWGIAALLWPVVLVAFFVYAWQAFRS